MLASKKFYCYSVCMSSAVVETEHLRARDEI